MLFLLCCAVLSLVQFFVTPWTVVACQASLSMGFSRKEYCNGLPFPTPGNFADPRIEPKSLESPALSGEFFTTCATWEAWGFCWLRVQHCKQDMTQLSKMGIWPPAQWKSRYPLSNSFQHWNWQDGNRVLLPVRQRTLKSFEIFYDPWLQQTSWGRFLQITCKFFFLT